MWGTFIPSVKGQSIFFFWTLSPCLSWTLCNPLCLFYVFVSVFLSISIFVSTESWLQYTFSHLCKQSKTDQNRNCECFRTPWGSGPFLTIVLSLFLSPLERIDYTWSLHFLTFLLFSPFQFGFSATSTLKLFLPKITNYLYVALSLGQFPGFVSFDLSSILTVYYFPVVLNLPDVSFWLSLASSFISSKCQCFSGSSGRGRNSHSSSQV